MLELTLKTNGIEKKHNMIWKFLGETPTTGMSTSGQTAAASIEEMRKSHPEVISTKSPGHPPLIFTPSQE